MERFYASLITLRPVQAVVLVLLLFASGDAESREPVDAASVIVNPPKGARIFGAGGFGGRPMSPAIHAA